MLVLDANILMRAVLGKRTRVLLATYGEQCELVAPDVAFEEARTRILPVIQRRNLKADSFLVYLESLSEVIRRVDIDEYAGFEAVARQRMARRDEDDWSILATALALGCPIWTEDTDFFGCGVATWTTDRVELYLSAGLAQ